MTKYGSDYLRARALFKAQCARTNEPCWLCHGPIDYTSAYDPSRYNPRLFNLDHATPVSLGGEAAVPRNFRASCARCNTSRGNTTRGQFPTSRRW